MVSNQGSSKTADWRDVAGNIVAFEVMNGVRLEIKVTTVDHRGRADLSVGVWAFDRKDETGDPKVLASVCVTCSATRLKTLEGVLIHALYMMDAKLVGVELWQENE